jgi:hypothetical protein
MNLIQYNFIIPLLAQLITYINRYLSPIFNRKFTKALSRESFLRMSVSSPEQIYSEIYHIGNNLYFMLKNNIVTNMTIC